MLHIAICDDEKSGREAVSEAAGAYFRARGIAFELTSFMSARALLKEGSRFDLYLLDVVMPEVDGITAAEHIRDRWPDAVIVFITSMIGSAVDSYRVEAAGFLLKPVTAETFQETADRLIRRGLIGEKAALSVIVDHNPVAIPLSRIAVLESELHRVHIYLDGTSYSISRRLGDLEEELRESPQFIRCHQSYIVNLTCVKEMRGSSFVLKDKLRTAVREVPISRAYLKKSKKAFYDHQLKRGF